MSAFPPRISNRFDVSRGRIFAGQVCLGDGKKGTKVYHHERSLSPRELIEAEKRDNLASTRHSARSKYFRAFDKSSPRFSTRRKVEQSPSFPPSLPLVRSTSVEKRRNEKDSVIRPISFFPFPPSFAFSSLRPDFNFHSLRRAPPSPANDRPGPLHCSETLENFRSGISTSRKTSSSSWSSRESKRRRETSRKFQSLGDGFASKGYGRMRGRGEFESGYSFRIERNYPTLLSFLTRDSVTTSWKKLNRHFFLLFSSLFFKEGSKKICDRLTRRKQELIRRGGKFDKEGGDKLHWSKFLPIKVPGKTVFHNSIGTRKRRAAAEPCFFRSEHIHYMSERAYVCVSNSGTCTGHCLTPF